MENKRFRRLLVYDLTVGGRRNLAAYVAGLLLLVFLSNMAVTLCRQMIPEGDFLECFRYFFYGAPRYEPENNSEFSLPVLWLLFYLYGLFLVGGYTQSDLRGVGKKVLLQCGSRRCWWLSKCIWVLVNETLFFAAALASVWFAAGGGKVKDLWGKIDLWGISLPFIVLITLALVQMTISLVTRPVFAFFLSVFQLVAAVYWDTPFLMGNYGMAARVEAGDVNCSGGYLLAVILSGTAVAAGLWSFGKKDVISIK